MYMEIEVGHRRVAKFQPQILAILDSAGQQQTHKHVFDIRHRVCLQKGSSNWKKLPQGFPAENAPFGVFLPDGVPPQPNTTTCTKTALDRTL